MYPEEWYTAILHNCLEQLCTRGTLRLELQESSTESSALAVGSAAEIRTSFENLPTRSRPGEPFPRTFPESP